MSDRSLVELTYWSSLVVGVVCVGIALLSGSWFWCSVFLFLAVVMLCVFARTADIRERTRR